VALKRRNISGEEERKVTALKQTKEGVIKIVPVQDSSLLGCDVYSARGGNCWRHHQNPRRHIPEDVFFKSQVRKSDLKRALIIADCIASQHTLGLTSYSYIEHSYN
jgi:hypothetical protein